MLLFVLLLLLLQLLVMAVLLLLWMPCTGSSPPFSLPQHAGGDSLEREEEGACEVVPADAWGVPLLPQFLPHSAAAAQMHCCCCFPLR